MMFNKKTKQQKKWKHKKTKVNNQENERKQDKCGLEIDLDLFIKLGLLCKLSFSLSCYTAMLPP